MARGFSTPQQRLDVFISSDIPEFRALRRELAEAVNRIPFLKSIPMERRGAAPDKVREVSLEGVRNCDIFIGILGKKYSDITAEEYEEAVKHHKLPLIYVKRVAERDSRVIDLIEKDVSSRFKYDHFTTNKELYSRARDDLESLLSRILKTGIEEMQRRKKQAETVEKQTIETVHTSSQSESDKVTSLLTEARSSFEDRRFLQATILSSVALEMGLREAFRSATLRRTVPHVSPTDLERIESMGLGSLISFASSLEIVSHRDADLLRQLAVMRNRTLHEGWIPSEHDAAIALKETRELLARLTRS
jgi:hypothetical protein